MTEAATQLQTGLSLDPTLPGEEADWVQFYAISNDCPRVLVESVKALALQPTGHAADIAHYRFASCLEKQGRFREAVEHYLRVSDFANDPHLVASALEAFEAGGMKAFWRVQHDELQRAIKSGKTVSAYDRAWSEVKIGNHEGAIEWLTRSVDAEEGPVCWINVDPDWNPLRGDPRFEALRHRLGFS